jgi:hypothetical protein
MIVNEKNIDIKKLISKNKKNNTLSTWIEK